MMQTVRGGNYRLREGKLKFNAGGRLSLYGKSILSDNQWRHVAVSFPQGSSLLSECILYVDGEVDSNESGQFTATPMFINPDVWLDAEDDSSMDKGALLGNIGSPVYGDPVGYWADKSGNGNHAILQAGSATYEVH